jgi:dienelactone hydrolase
MKIILAFVSLTLFCAAQEQALVYPATSPESVIVRNGVTYKTSGSTALAFDLFRPASAGKEQRLPVFVIFNGFGGSFMRNSPQARGWAGIAAAHGLAAVTMETTSGHVTEDFDSFVGYLREHAAELQLDPEQIAVIAWSGNAGIGLETVEDPARASVKAAVIYYGGRVLSHLRLDLPVFLVRAGLDGPGVNVTMNQAIAAAIPANAPWTVVNYPGGHHGFDGVDDNDISRQIIEETFQFVRHALSPSYQAALRLRLPEAAASAAFSTGDYKTAASLYAAIVESHPQDVPSLLAYGRSLIGAKHYKEARKQFDRVKAIGTAGPRDLGIPAARACALDNDPEAAVAWLKTIPQQFLPKPQEFEDDPDFATLKNRADFQALFAQH